MRPPSAIESRSSSRFTVQHLRIACRWRRCHRFGCWTSPKSSPSQRCHVSSDHAAASTCARAEDRRSQVGRTRQTGPREPVASFAPFLLTPSLSRSPFLSLSSPRYQLVPLASRCTVRLESRGVDHQRDDSRPQRLGRQSDGGGVQGGRRLGVGPCSQLTRLAMANCHGYSALLSAAPRLPELRAFTVEFAGAMLSAIDLAPTVESVLSGPLG